MILLRAETLGRKLNHTDSLCRKLFTKHNSLGRKQEIAGSLCRKLKLAYSFIPCVNHPMTAYVIETLRIHKVTQFCMIVCWKFYCNSCMFQSLQKATTCTNSISNRAFLQHKSQRPIFFLVPQTFRLNTFHLVL